VYVQIAACQNAQAQHEGKSAGENKRFSEVDTSRLAQRNVNQWNYDKGSEREKKSRQDQSKDTISIDAEDFSFRQFLAAHRAVHAASHLRRVEGEGHTGGCIGLSLARRGH